MLTNPPPVLPWESDALTGDEVWLVWMASLVATVVLIVAIAWLVGGKKAVKNLFN